MVKISIKKDKKTKIKPRQKQKQKQSQKVIVNVGGNAVKTRRATTQTLQKNLVNKQMPTPNIYVPQSNPLYKQSDSTSEILKYIKESEQQKELIKKQEKTNELEKDKVKKASTVPTEEKAQVQFTMINNTQDISGVSSGIATPHYNPLTTPLNFKSLENALGSLIHRADLEGENPNTGRISLSTYNPASSGSSIMSDGGYNDDHDSVVSNQSRTPLTHTPYQDTLIDLLQNKLLVEPAQEEDTYIEPDTEEKTIINETSQQETETQGEPLETITNEPSQVDAFIIETPKPEKTAYEQADEAITIIDQALKPNKETESTQAEDLSSIVKVKNTKKKADESASSLGAPSLGAPSLGAPTTPYTRDQIKKMKLQKVGDIITAEKIVDKNGRKLVFNGGRIFPEGTLKDETNLPEVKKRILLHYGMADP